METWMFVVLMVVVGLAVSVVASVVTQLIVNLLQKPEIRLFLQKIEKHYVALSWIDTGNPDKRPVQYAVLRKSGPSGTLEFIALTKDTFFVDLAESPDVQYTYQVADHDDVIMGKMNRFSNRCSYTP